MSNRGRGSFKQSGNRGRSQSKPSDRPVRRRSYEDIEREAKQDRQHEEEKIKKVESTQLPPPNVEKKQSLVQKGQQWFNKFFSGIKRRERGNMQLEFNIDIDLQIYDVYSFRLSNLAFSKNYYEEFHVKFSDTFFRIYVDFLIGIKLLKANTDTGKVLLKEFQPLVNLDIKVPKNLGALINSLGKTDVQGENVVRIIGQNSIVKTMFFKSVMLCAARDKRFYNNMTFLDGITFDNVTAWVEENLLKQKLLKIYTEDKAGVDLLHSYGKRAVEFINTFDINVGTDEAPVHCRAPYFDPKYFDNIDKILEWAEKVKNFFTHIKYSQEQCHTTLGYVLMGWFPLKFLRGKTKKMGTLDSRFKKTIFENLTPQGILISQGWTSLSVFMDDDMLYNNTVTVIDYFKSSIEPIYEDMFQMTKFEPTEFGSGAQICIINDHRRKLIEFDEHSFEFGQADNKVPANTHARITDEEAVIGSIFDFNLGVFVENSFDVRTIGSAKEIRLAYLGHDFK